MRSDNIVHLLTLFATHKLLLRTTALPSHAFYMPFVSMLVLARLLLWLCSFLVSVVDMFVPLHSLISFLRAWVFVLLLMWVYVGEKYVYIIYTNLDVSERRGMPLLSYLSFDVDIIHPEFMSLRS